MSDFKMPESKLKSQDLESLFQRSSIQDRHFFPRRVPGFPSLKEAEVKKKNEEKLK